MNDLISREAAIEVVSKEGCGICIQKIVDLPIEKAQQWIPCSERLPKMPVGEHDYYDCTKGEDIPADKYIVTIKNAVEATVLYWTGQRWVDPDDDYCENEYDVIAWRPLLEPYVEVVK